MRYHHVPKIQNSQNTKCWQWYEVTQMLTGGFIHNCQNLEATKVSFNGWLDKQTVVHPYNGVWFSTKNKTKIPIKPLKDNTEFKCILLRERCQIWKVYTLCDSNYMTFWKRQKYGDS